MSTQGHEMLMVQKARAGRVLDTMTFLLTDDRPDGVGDTFSIPGMQLDTFKANPVALMSHDRVSMPVGVWGSLRPIRNPDGSEALLGDLQLAAKGTTRAADIARGLIEQGILRAVSVGARVLKAEPRKPRGYHFASSELLEVSLVSVPMNPRALMVAKSLAMTDDEIKTFFADPPVGNGDEVTKAIAEQKLRYDAAHRKAVYGIINATRAARKRGEL